MPTQEQKRQDLARVWSSRVSSANTRYKDWAEEFKVEDLEEAYYGHQWEKAQVNNDEYMPYVLNMIFSSIDVKMPSLLFDNPVFSVSPRPNKMDFDPQSATFRARLREDALNFFVQGGIENFANEIELAILDAWFRFGVVEVGYSADYIKNPDAGQPYLKSDSGQLTDKKGEVIRQPDFLPEQERIYVKRIPAERFRVGGVDPAHLNRCSWYGYLDFVRKEDLLASAKVNPGYNKQVIEDATQFSPDSEFWKEKGNLNFYDKGNWDNENNYDVIAVWKIYDLRSKTMYMFTYDVDEIIYQEEIQRVQHFALKFRPRLKGWYPLPPVFNWLSAQAEVNETREAARIHRRRFQRKYIYRIDAFDEEEMDKLQNGGDGTFAGAKTDVNMAVAALPSPNLGAQHDQAMIMSRDDFNIISGTSAEQRGQSDRTTATQSQIKERRSEIRESRDKAIIANWLIDIGKEIITIAKEELVNPFWIQLSQDSPDLFAEVDFTQKKWAEITGDEFGDEDMDVAIKVSSMSPVDQQQEKNKLVEFLSLVTQFPQVQMSPMMIQEIADKTGFRNERAIAEFVRMAQLLQANQILQLAMQSGQDPAQLMLEMFMRNAQQNGGGQQPQGNAIAQRTTAQMTPPDMETIQNQIGNQVVQQQNEF